MYDNARRLGLQLHVVRASTVTDVGKAFDTIVQLRAGALVVSADLFLHSQRKQLVALAARYALPTIYAWREGLISYGPNLFEANRLIGVYCGKILRGVKAADLPVKWIL